MDREYEYLLELLGAYLQGREPGKPEGVDWQKLVQLAKIHSVIGILGCMTMQYPICPDAQMKADLRLVCLNTIGLFTKRAALADSLIEELNKAGMDHILMKGYVLRNYYPIPELRTFNDIDLVIRPEDREKSHKLMLSLGFQPVTDWEPVFSYVRSNEHYELHAEIMEIDVSDKADYRGYFRCMWQHAYATGVHSYQFAPEFHFLYMLTHIAKHIHGSGAGARMYLDVAAFILHFGDTIDWSFIVSELKDLALFDFASVVLTAVEEWFGVQSPVAKNPVSESVMAEFTAFTMEAGVFGHYQREGGVTALKKSDQEKHSRLRTLLQRTFPSAETIQTRYTYLQDKPWLLPVAWVHRLIKTRKSFGAHAHEAQVIISASSEEVRRLQRITRDIGL